MRYVYMIALILAPWWLAAQPAAAQTQPTCTGAITEPRQLTIECRPGYATAADRIVIESRRELDPAKSWDSQIDDRDATWIFDTKADGSANLIIIFAQQGSQISANIFDDQTGDKVVAYRRDGQQIVVIEGRGLPTLVVKAQDGWKQADGSTNFNYDIEVDGQVEGMIDANKIYLERLATDGTIDLTAHVRDSDKDGRPDYEWRQAHPPLPEHDGFYHSSVMVNTADDEPPIKDALFWPLLGTGSANFIKEDYASTSKPPVNIDWERSKINYLVESVASRNRPYNYFIYSIYRITEGQLNDVNFESPFAFYKLSPVQSNFPDVALRVAYHPIGNVSQHLPIEEIDISWRQLSENVDALPTWDYRLGLTGHNAHQGQVTFPEFSLRITPYDKLPRWVNENSWDYSTFVAREAANYLSSEGIYEWSTLEGAIIDVNNAAKYEDLLLATRHAGEDYVHGALDRVPTELYHTIRPGLRGEFRSRTAPPDLYFSPVDRKLHILGADHGVWPIDEHQTLRYANLDHDHYLDQWTYTATTTGTTTLTTTRQLNVAPRHMLYSDQAGITIRAARVQPSLFETLPPTNQSEWEKLGAQLSANLPQFAPDDLQAQLRQFTGPEMRLSGATLRDYRPVGKTGFRFVLTLKPGFSSQGTPMLPVEKLQPGDYAVSYDGTFQVLPLTPPAPAATIHTSALNQLESAAIQLTLSNNGLQDLPPSMLELWAAPPNAEAQMVVSDTVTLLAQQPLTTTLMWTPPDAGTWTITPKLRLAGARVITLEPAEISVAPAQTVSADALIAVSASFKTLPLILATVCTFAVLAAYLWRQQWRSFTMEQADDSA